ncbi:MAG: hypothetical protein H0T89_03095 [Deltaproteobacteria bacterium]|nr:hypothetical protein [Deltaproteobacteria bacterium]
MRFVLLALFAGCTNTTSVGSIQLDSADGELGVGGHAFFTLYLDGELSDDARLVATDGSVVHVETGSAGSIVGVAPGTSDVMMIVGDDVVDVLTIGVAEVTALHLDGIDQLVAGAPVVVGFESMIGNQRSRGTHYYEVALDGTPYTCWGDVPRFCNGPIYYDMLHLDGLTVGEHQLAFRAVDGGRDFAFVLRAR